MGMGACRAGNDNGLRLIDYRLKGAGRLARLVGARLLALSKLFGGVFILIVNGTKMGAFKTGDFVCVETSECSRAYQADGHGLCLGTSRCNAASIARLFASCVFCCLLWRPCHLITHYYW